MWALGATLYTAVEGIPPFHGPTPAAVIAAVLTGTPRPPEHAGPLRELLDALLAVAPFRRPDAQTVARALARQRSGPVTGSWTAASPGTARSGPPVAPGPTQERAMHADARSGRQAYPEQWYDDPRPADMQGSRSASPPAPDPRLEGIRYDELRYEEPSADGPGYGEPIDDESWVEELRRSAPAYPRRSGGQPTINRGKASSESTPGTGPGPAASPAAFFAAPRADQDPIAPPVRPGYGLDGPEITSAWPAQPWADDEAESFEEFWAEDDDEDGYAGPSSGEDPDSSRRRPTFPRGAPRMSGKATGKARGIPGRGRHRRGSVPQADPTAAGGSQSGGPRVRGGDLQGMPGRAAPESTPAKSAPGGPVVPPAPADPVALPAPEQRFLQGRFPERVRLGEEVSLLVRLGLRPGGRLAARLRPVRVPEAGLEIVLLLVDSPGFALRSPERTVVQVSPRQDSNWASFELQATREGVHTLQVEAFAGGTGLGGLPIQVSVDAITRTGRSMERSSPAGAAAANPGEISMLLSYDADQHVYRYRLVDSGGYYSEEAASDRLLQPPGQAIEQLVTQLNALARGQETWDAATTKDWLKGQGITLWNSFIPYSLQREFWKRHDRITQMTIISQGDPVPWELLYPFAPGGRDAGFLVDQFPVTRRRYGPRPPGRLELGTADLVLSRDHSLTAAPAEIAALDGLLRDRGMTARHIDDLPGLLQAFRRGDVGLLHFSCHNAFARGTPNASRILLRDQPFEPVFLEQHAARFAAPLVFLNACRTDGQAPLYTTVEGWASSFLRPAPVPSSALCGRCPTSRLALTPRRFTGPRWAATPWASRPAVPARPSVTTQATPPG